jgi:phenylacetic acid degradation operon negative regulatory protein
MNDMMPREIPTRVLLESMVRPDGSIDAAELYSVANALDMSDQQVRLGIRRAIADGQLVQEGRGRRAVLHASAAMSDVLKPDMEFVAFAYEQDRGLAPWDGQWHVAAFAIPETSRPARDAMRAGVVRLGGAPIQGGLYVSPNAWEPHVAKLSADFDVRQCLSSMTTTDLRVGELSSPGDIAARLWPLDDIAERHDRLLKLAQRGRTQLRGRRELTRTEYLTVALELAAEFTAAMEPDPLLPSELLPKAWVGARARAAFAQCWAQLGDIADDSVPRLFQNYADATR